MTSHDDRFDELFLRAAGTAGGIQPLLNAFFSFLNRRTDFYVVHEAKRGQSYAAGFASGQAEKMLFQAFHSFPMNALDQVLKETKPKEKTKSVSVAPPTTKAKTEPDVFAHVQYTDDRKQVPVGNGGVAETYSWTQTLTETTIIFEVPTGTTAKDITCTISSTRLDLKIANGDSLSGRFHTKIADDGSMWTLDRDANGRASLLISLEKISETWWPSVFADAKPNEIIDTTKVDSSKKIDEYDELTQATIRKIMFDQRQKAKGLPTSDEIQNKDLLEKFKHLPGSPFLSSASSSDDATTGLPTLGNLADADPRIASDRNSTAEEDRR